VQRALADGRRAGNETLRALEIPLLDLKVPFEGEIKQK
jgi:hypothetical protein